MRRQILEPKSGKGMQHTLKERLPIESLNKNSSEKLNQVKEKILIWPKNCKKKLKLQRIKLKEIILFMMDFCQMQSLDETFMSIKENLIHYPINEI